MRRELDKNCVKECSLRHYENYVKIKNSLYSSKLSQSVKELNGESRRILRQSSKKFSASNQRRVTAPLRLFAKKQKITKPAKIRARVKPGDHFLKIQNLKPMPSRKEFFT